MEAEANIAIVRRGFELFNAADFDALFNEVFAPDIEYRADPQISALTGLPVEVRGPQRVREVWESFFEMFDDVQLGGVELEPGGRNQVLGHFNMVTRGGSSEVPIDVPFHCAWVIQDGRCRFLSVKLDRGEVMASLEAWLEADEPGA